MKNQEILNQEEHDQELPAVLSAFTSIYKGNTKEVSYSDTYNSIYKLCKRGMAQQILKQLDAISVQNFQTLLQKVDNNEAQSSNYTDLIKQVQESIQRISQILLYIQSNYIHDQKREYNSIKDMLNAVFFQYLCKNKNILLRVSGLIADARINSTEQQIKELISAINHLDQKEVFFNDFLREVYETKVSNYYKVLFTNNFQKLSLKQFMTTTRQKIRNQREWLQKNFMRGKNKKNIEESIKRIYDASLGQLKQKIYKQKSEQIFKSDMADFLELLNEKNDIKEINDCNSWYVNKIKQRLTKIDRSKNNEFLKNFVLEYLFISECLAGIKNFNIGYKATFFFDQWINEDKINLPKRLNIYLENLVLLSESNSDQGLKNFAILFKFLKQKDYFQKQFRRLCAIRMVYDPSKSNTDFQISAINEMANQCSSDWVQKLTILKSAVTECQKLTASLPPKFNALVFEDAVWPFDKLKKQATIHPDLLALAGNYKQTYQQAFKGRVIEWHPLHGFAIVSIKFDNCRQEFKMDTVMSTLLLNLQSSKYKSTVKEILAASNLDLDNVSDQLELLAKQKIIDLSNPKDPLASTITLCSSYNPTSTSTDTIDFTHRYLEQEFIQKHGHEQLKAERKMMVEAYIVKIMKANKELSKPQLYTHITPMIQGRGFKFSEEFVENAFNGLIDKRYIKDLQNGRFMYLSS